MNTIGDVEGPQLNPADDERLTGLGKECAEARQVAAAAGNRKDELRKEPPSVLHLRRCAEPDHPCQCGPSSWSRSGRLRPDPVREGQCHQGPKSHRLMVVFSARALPKVLRPEVGA